MELLEPTLPQDVPHLFISAVTNYNITALKDIIWEELNKESETVDMIHAPIEVRKEEADFDIEYTYEELDEDSDDEHLDIEEEF